MTYHEKGRVNIKWLDRTTQSQEKYEGQIPHSGNSNYESVVRKNKKKAIRLRNEEVMVNTTQWHNERTPQSQGKMKDEYHTVK